MNRFDQSTPQQYVSTFVPQKFVEKPLEALTNLAKDYSDKYKQGINDINQAQNEFLKVNAIDKHKPYKEQIIKSYKDKIEQLSDEFIKNPTDYNNKMKLNKLINDWKADPNRQELEKSYEDYNKDIKSVQKLTEDGKYGAWNDAVSNFNNNYKNGEFTPYRSKGINAAQNHMKGAKELMGKFAADFLDIDITKVGPDGITRGYKNGIEVVSDDKVWKEAYGKSSGFLDSPDGQDFIRKIKHEYPQADDSFIQKQAIQLLHDSASEQIFKHVKKGYSEDVNRMWKTLHDEANQDNMPGLGQAQPGSAVYNLTDDIPESIKGAISTKDGKVNIDFTKLGGGIKIEGASGSPYTMGTTGNMSASKSDNIQNHKDLAKFIIKAADAIGYKGQIKSDNYNEILTKYMEGAKSVSFDYKMIPNEQQVVKNDIIEYPDHYTYTDEKGKPIVDRPTDEKNPLTKDNLNVGRRVYKDGQAKIEIEYMEGNTPKKMYAQPLALEDKNYHNVVAKIQEDGLNFYKTGKPADTKEVKDLNEKYGFNKPGYSGLKPISAITLPNGKIALTLGDKNNRIEQIYELFNSKTGEREEFQNMAQMMEVLNKEWFSTNQGKGQASSIKLR